MCKMFILVVFDEREDSNVILIDMPLTSYIIIVGFASTTSLQSHALFDRIYMDGIMYANGWKQSTSYGGLSHEDVD